MLRLFLLFALLIAVSALWVSTTNAEEYNRKLYRHWIDEDKDCQNTRMEVLIKESLTPVRLDSTGCRVLEGNWLCPYTGRTFTDPRKLDIDHYVPLAEAHESGGSSWTAQKRRDYANDLTHPNTLIAVYLGANRSKGKRDPALWMPPNEEYRCEYAIVWLSIKKYWGLSFDEAEREALHSIMDKCLQKPDEAQTNPETKEPAPEVKGKDTGQYSR